MPNNFNSNVSHLLAVVREWTTDETKTKIELKFNESTLDNWNRKLNSKLMRFPLAMFPHSALKSKSLLATCKKFRATYPVASWFHVTFSLFIFYFNILWISAFEHDTCTKLHRELSSVGNTVVKRSHVGKLKQMKQIACLMNKFMSYLVSSIYESKTISEYVSTSNSSYTNSW